MRLLNVPGLNCEGQLAKTTAEAERGMQDGLSSMAGVRTQDMVFAKGRHTLQSKAERHTHPFGSVGEPRGGWGMLSSLIPRTMPIHR